MGVLPACLTVYHMHVVPLEAKRVTYTLGLEVQTLVRHYVGSDPLEE